MDTNETQHRNLFKIGEIADRAGTSVRTVRYYMEEGFIEAAARSTGGFYLFSPETGDTVFFIQKLKGAGLSLKEIKAIYTARKTGRTGEEASKKVLEHLKNQKAAVEQKIKDYQRLNAELDEAIEMVAQCRGCTAQPSRERCESCAVVRRRKTIPLPVRAIL